MPSLESAITKIELETGEGNHGKVSFLLRNLSCIGATQFNCRRWMCAVVACTPSFSVKMAR